MNYDYLARRLLFALLSVGAAVSLVFVMIHLIPGDPVSVILGDYFNATAAAQLRQQLGLDMPLWRQYVLFIGNLVSGDLGTSFITRQPVLAEVMGNFQFTVQLAVGGLFVSVALGVPLGVVAALQRGKAIDFLAMNTAILGVSIPNFWLGILLMIVFSVNLEWLPLIGVGDRSRVGSVVLHLILPAVTLGVSGAGLIARVTRSAMLETLSQDYVRTARSKGLTERIVIMRHAFRNALLPIVTVVGLDLGRMLGGTTVVETVFSRPGTGTLLIKSVLNRDYPSIQGTFLLFLLIIIVVNFLVDLLYVRLDPRVVYS